MRTRKISRAMAIIRVLDLFCWTLTTSQFDSATGKPFQLARISNALA